MPLAVPDLAAALAPRIASLEPCWFAGLSGVLVDRFWADPRPVTSVRYSTAAWLGEPGGAPRIAIPGTADWYLDPLPARFASRFEAAAIAPMAAAQALATALARLEAGGARDTLVPLIRSVHAVAAYGPGYDCSHSEPAIPFSVLVSIPLGERDATLRLAESLLHEAMHLQLTLIEAYLPIAREGTAGAAYSPWQQCWRPAKGLLHGLYVFAAIDAWLAAVQDSAANGASDCPYAERRRAEIREEVSMVSDLPASIGLTPFGRALAAGLLARLAVTGANDLRSVG
jgi:HEXXH motif-containing protein